MNYLKRSRLPDFAFNKTNCGLFIFIFWHHVPRPCAFSKVCESFIGNYEEQQDGNINMQFLYPWFAHVARSLRTMTFISILSLRGIELGHDESLWLDGWKSVWSSNSVQLRL